MRENSTLTRYRIYSLISVQDIEKVEWRVSRRVVMGILDIDNDPRLETFINLSKILLKDYGQRDLATREFEVEPRTGGRVIVYEAAYHRPIIEFNPNNITGQD